MIGGPRWRILFALAVAIGCGDDPVASGPAPVSVAIEPRRARIGIGKTVELEWVAFDAQGERLTWRPVHWVQIRGPGQVRVEAVTGEGTTYNVARVSGQDNGTSTISAAWKGTTATAWVDVFSMAHAQLTAPDTLRALGDTVRVGVEAFDEHDRPIQAEELDWESSDESVVIVDSTGLVTAVGNGTSAVGVYFPASRRAFTLVTVAQLATDVSIETVADTLRALGDTLRLSAEARDANGHPVTVESLSWSTADESVVAVAGQGVVTAVGHGTAEVYAASRQDTASAAVTVEQRAVGARVVPSADTLRAPQDTLRLEVARVDANGHPLPQTPVRIDWSSSDEAVATVDPEGLVTAIGEGAVEIAASMVEAGFVATTSIRVLFVGERDVLAALYHATGGPHWTRNDNWLTGAPLNTWHGIETDAQGRVVRLEMGNNRLSGSIPPELGYLDELRVLDISYELVTGTIPRQLGRLKNLKSLRLTGNRLTGVIPAELGALDSLEDLNLANNNLAAMPAELGKLSNLKTLDISSNELTGGILPQLAELTKLRAMWLDENNFTGSIPPELGELASLEVLDLGYNSLTGRIPRELGKLVSLRELDLASYRTDGSDARSIPAELGSLSRLTRLNLALSDLTGEIPQELANLVHLNELDIGANELTGSIPAWLGDLSHLQYLYLQSNHLSGAIPPELGRLTELRYFFVHRNDLMGSIPVELGNLTKLEALLLSDNPQLEGPLPRELGTLPELWSLQVDTTGLSGPIPREFVNLPLEVFAWSGSRLCAPLDPAFQTWLESIRRRWDGPPCVADGLAALYEEAGGEGWTKADNWLTDAPVSEWHGVTAQADGRVTALDLRGNRLAGTVPPEIGVLRDLTRLDLRDNALSGDLPAELGQLGELRQLHLSANRFEGELPDALGSLSELTTLDVARNLFTGALPGSLAKLSELADFRWSESGLCAPPADWFQHWLGTIAYHAGGPDCSPLWQLSMPAVHVNQAVQSLEGNVPLIAGRTGLLRVFATADKANDLRPRARATFFLNGRQVHRAEMELGSDHGIPEDPVSGEPDQYFRARIPGNVLIPGVEMVVEVDPDRVVPRAPESVVRHPQSGRAALDVREMPAWELTVVPVLAAQDPDSTVLDWVAGMGPGHPAIEYVTNLFPVGEYSARLREPFVRSHTSLYNIWDWSFFAREIRLLRLVEAGTGTYYGVVGSAPGAIGGVGRPPVAVGKTSLYTMAHELGHTMSLGHAPCGLVFDADPLYPQSDGSIGVWGYDARGDSLVTPAALDVMGYCDDTTNWISDYHFDKALRYRLDAENIPPRTAARETPLERGRHLLLWGGASPEGELTLDPAFVLDIPSQPPSRPGPYRLEGFGAGGESEFSLDFAMNDIDHGGGGFLFAIPFEEDWYDLLQRIVLSGPEGMVELNEYARDPVALVLDRETGRLRSVLRGEDAAVALTMTSADAAGPSRPGSNTRTLVSFGLPGRTPPN